MNLTIQKEMQQPLLSRKVVTLKLLYEGVTPSKLELRKKVADLTKVAEDHVTIQNVSTEYGTTQGSVVAHVYSNAQLIPAVELVHIGKRIEKLQSKGKKDAAPAAA
jgi:small subunit ribosomal protein S24e